MNELQAEKTGGGGNTAKCLTNGNHDGDHPNYLLLLKRKKTYRAERTTGAFPFGPAADEPPAPCAAAVVGGGDEEPSRPSSSMSERLDCMLSITLLSPSLTALGPSCKVNASEEDSVLYHLSGGFRHQRLRSGSRLPGRPVTPIISSNKNHRFDYNSNSLMAF
jgi:hypothetical protein